MSAEGAARLLTLLASARADDVPRVLGLVAAPDLARGVLHPGAEVCPLVAEHLAAHADDRVARAVAERMAMADVRGPAPDASGGVTRLLRERFGAGGGPGAGAVTDARGPGRRVVVRQRSRSATPLTGRGRDILMHPAPDLATARSALHDYLLPQPWLQPDPKRVVPSYRALLIRGLERGSIDAATLLRDGQPGATIVELAAHDRIMPADGRVDRARRARADLAWELRRLVETELGAQVGRWHRTLTGVQETAHSFARLAHDQVFLPGLEVVSRRGLWDRWTVANTLLAIAPASVVAQLMREADDFPYGPSAEHPPSLAAINRDDDAVFAVAVAHNAPLSRAVVEFVLGNDAPTHMRERQREALASNPDTPDSVLRRLLASETVTGDLCRRIFRRADADEALCSAIFRMAPYPDFNAEWYASLLAPRPTAAQLAPLRDAADATWVHEAVRQAAVRIEGAGLLACYVRLADVAGLEPVWAVELDRVGRIERMDAAVRESMAVGDAGALAAGAGELAGAVRSGGSGGSGGPNGSAEPAMAVGAGGSTGPVVPGRRTDDVVDDPVAWPLEDAVRAGLDGRPANWRLVVKALMSGADEPLPEVVAACAARG